METMCLALIIYFEARSEPIDGKLAIVDVVLTRKGSNRWPNTICKVMKQPKQFSFYKDHLHISDLVAYKEATTIARHVVSGYRPNIVNADHYHTSDISPYWSVDMKVVNEIGNHIFYKDN